MTNRTPLFAFIVVLLLAITAVLSPLAGAAPSAGYVVNTSDDSDDGTCDATHCSLREAMIAINGTAGKDTITFNFDGTITLKSALPSVGDDLRIDGSGQEIVISGDNTVRIFNLIAGDNIPILELNELTLNNGRGDKGGLVHNNGGELEVTNTLFKESRGLENGGAIYNLNGATSVTDCTFDGNFGKSGGAIFNHAGTLTVARSTFIDNISLQDGGAIYNSAGSSEVTNSTFWRNKAAAGIVFDSDGGTEVINSTFSANISNAAVMKNPNINSQLVLRNTILDDKDALNCEGSITNGGNNIDSGTTCGWGSGNGSKSSTNPKLAPPADNGGPTVTVALYHDSPVIDKVPVIDCPVNSDQRGLPRPQGSDCDAGAYETNAQAGPDLIVNVLGDSDDGSCDQLVHDVTDCTLREAIKLANALPGKNMITFAVTGGIDLNSTLPVIGDDLLIDFNDQIALSAADKYRAMTLVAGDNIPELELLRMHLFDGSSDNGGAIYNDGGELVIAKSNIQSSTASEDGGAIYNKDGATTVVDSSLSSNSAKNGGAIFNRNGTLTIERSWFYNNGYKGSPNDGVVIYNSFGTTTVTNSTFSENSADNADTIFNNEGTTIVTNSTFSKNKSKAGTINNSKGSVTLLNTILNDVGAKNCAGTITNGGNNIDSGATCGWGSANGSMSSTDPLLGSQSFHGGLTPVYALLPDSPAIDGVKFNSPNDCPDTDQRGVERPQFDFCDIGAYELAPIKIYLPLVMNDFGV